MYSFRWLNKGRGYSNLRQSVRKSNPILAIINNLLIDLPTPSNLNYWWNGGSLLGLCLVIQLITGIFIAMHYCPSTDLAFQSVEHLVRDVNYGYVLRYVHANGASVFFLIVYWHIGRGLYYGGYRGGMVWNVGVIIFLVMIITAFLGYVLPWGQMSYWAATVITNLLSAIPYIGGDLVQWVWGGFSVSNATLNRFLSLHYALPFILVGLVGIHLIALHEMGSGNPIGAGNNLDKVEFHYYYAIKDAYGMIVMLIGLSILVFWYPYLLSDVENYKMADPLVTPVHIKPEWYFLFVYAILRSIPNKLGGVLALIMSVVILWVIPFLHTHPYRGTRFRPLGKIVFWIMVNNFFILTWIGGQPVEYPYETIGQIASITYFLLFIMVIPAIGWLERQLIIK